VGTREIVHPFLQQPQRVATVGRYGNPLDWIRRDKRVPAQLRVPHGAIEKHHARQGGQPAEHGNRVEARIETLN
jgi:hypothetical protein